MNFEALLPNIAKPVQLQTIHLAISYALLLLNKQWRLWGRRIHVPETLKLTKTCKVRERKSKAPLTSGMSSHKGDSNFSENKLS